jgi:hypothetical protein
MSNAVRPYTPLLLFWALVHLFYAPTWNAGFVTDFTGLMMRLEGQSISGVLNCFGFPALEQLLNLCLYLIYKAFGSSPLPWYLLFTTTHALNAFLLFRLSKNLFLRFKIKLPTVIALTGALFFLISPYQSEVLVWRVCFNFLLVTFLILLTLIQTIKWLDHGKRATLMSIYLLSFLSLFVFELALMLPFLCLLTLLFFWRFEEQPFHLGQKLWRLSSVQFLFLAIYFGLNKLILGTWVGHYGAAVHLRFDFAEIMSNSLRFLVKTLGFVRYYPHPLKEKIFNLIGQNHIWIPYVLIMAGLALITLIWLRNKQRKFGLGLLFLFLGLFALVPILNLYFNYLLHIENDRYGYLASAFLLMGFAVFISYCPQILRWIITLSYLMISSFFLLRTNQYWSSSTQVYYSLLEQFDWYEADHVFLLNLPDNLKGAPMFRDYSGKDQAFNSPLKYIRKKAFEGQLHEVVQYNMTDRVNGVTVQQDSTNLKVEFKQWGNWWWRRGIGATGVENEWYQFSNQGHHYMFTPKTIPPNSVYLYQDGLDWKEFSILPPE